MEPKQQQFSIRVVKALKFFLTGLFVSGILTGYGEAFAAVGSAAGGLTRTNSGGGVTVNVTYPHSQAANETRFEVVLDTHSVNLDAYDLKTTSVLRDDTGKNYQPIRVDNKGSGHHREITIVFPKVSSPAKRLELVIKDVAGINERSFFWDLQ
jgi:FlaG/FlaF family flagellin (archaellin)